MSLFEEYPCVGVCTDDPDSGYCLGCGRPPATEEPPAVTQPATEGTDERATEQYGDIRET